MSRCEGTMRVLHLASHLETGGITSYVCALGAALVRRGHQVAVAADGGALDARLAELGVAHWPVPLHTSAEFSPQAAVAVWRLARRLRREPMDVLHAHTRIAQVVGGWLASRLRLPLVTTWHGRFRPNLGRALWPCTGDVTIAVSEPVREHLRREFRVPDSKIRLIPNGVDVRHFAAPADPALVRACRRALGIPEGAPVIGSIGRLASGPLKGFDLLLVSARRLRAEFPGLQVLLAGDGPGRRALERRAIELGLGTRVRFLGTVADVRVPLALLDVFVFPVREEEGFGLSLVEAMAAGRPVVATRAGAVPGIVEHGQSGWLVEPGQSEALVAGIALLLRDRAEAERLGQGARARAGAAFTLERVADQVEAVYREVLARRLM